MAEILFPLDDSPIPDSATWAKIASLWRGDGVIKGLGGELAVSPGTGLSVDVASGVAMVQGVWYENTATKNLALSPADPSNPRIDLVVVRVDFVNGSAQSGLAVLEGTPAASPVAPTPTQNAGVLWEIPIAEVYIAAGATSVSTITDRRIFADPGRADIIADITLATDVSSVNISVPDDEYSAFIIYASAQGNYTSNRDGIQISLNGNSSAVNAMYVDVLTSGSVVGGALTYIDFLVGGTAAKGGATAVISNEANALVRTISSVEDRFSIRQGVISITPPITDITLTIKAGTLILAGSKFIVVGLK